jgi:hypothetical protein
MHYIRGHARSVCVDIRPVAKQDQDVYYPNHDLGTKQNGDRDGPCLFRQYAIARIIIAVTVYM